MKVSDIVVEGWKDFVHGALRGAGMSNVADLVANHPSYGPVQEPEQPPAPTAPAPTAPATLDPAVASDISAALKQLGHTPAEIQTLVASIPPGSSVEDGIRLALGSKAAPAPAPKAAPAPAGNQVFKNMNSAPIPAAKQKRSDSMQGQNNWSKGKKWWTNGEQSMTSIESPGPNWVPGRGGIGVRK